MGLERSKVSRALAHCGPIVGSWSPGVLAAGGVVATLWLPHPAIPGVPGRDESAGGSRSASPPSIDPVTPQGGVHEDCPLCPPRAGEYVPPIAPPYASSTPGGSRCAPPPGTTSLPPRPRGSGWVDGIASKTRWGHPRAPTPFSLWWAYSRSWGSRKSVWRSWF